MSYLDRKSDKALSAIGGGKDGIKNLKIHLKNAYDEVERLLGIIADNQGFSFFLIDLLIKILNQ
jgi:hypothetical protein